METVSNVLGKSLNNYYERLFNVGYKNDATINKLIVLMWLQEILDGNIFSQYVTDKDVNLMLCVLSCLYDSDCAIGRPDMEGYEMAYYNDETMYLNAQDDLIRETEWDVQRSSTEDILRKKVIATR